MRRIILALAALGMLSGAAFAAGPPVLPNSANGDPLNAPYGGVVALTPDTPVNYPGRSIGIVCTVAGNVSMTLLDGSVYVVPVTVGFNLLPFAVSKVNSSGTTATATYANLQ